ncbi:hypothetical protein [Rugosimonospora africana]|uniref:DUF5666 domain-containing protein n=1 Tax=Rugosimonospora africana TaxID=556532 RepID=A0A8J3QXS7_9ACTN|nr:hypothetical protein [Rugosimonospora africana]GIH18254.1 hypothetical protein Raf01_64260 [Rugosimonospora africana]
MNPYARHADDTAELDPIGATTAGLATDAPDTPAGSGAELAHDVDLSQDPFADDLSEQLEAVAPRRWTSRTTVALAGLVLLVAGFVGGAQVEKHWGTPNGGTGRPAAFPSGNPFAAGGFGGRFGGTGGAGGAGGGTARGGQNSGGQSSGGQGGATNGTVKLVDGDTVYITTPQGQTVIVKTTGSTAVTVPQAGSLKDLAPGTSVTIQGQTGSDGSVNATSITKTK